MGFGPWVWVYGLGLRFRVSTLTRVFPPLLGLRPRLDLFGFRVRLLSDRAHVWRPGVGGGGVGSMRPWSFGKAHEGQRTSGLVWLELGMIPDRLALANALELG